MSTSLVCSILIGLLSPGDRQPANPAALSWIQVERQIQWHRDHVRWCGPLSVIRSLQLLGHHVDPDAVLEPLRDGDPRGLPLGQILQLCRAYDPYARLVHVPRKRWRQLATPCILLVNEGRHALVLQSWSAWRGQAEIWDPSVLQVTTVPLAQLESIWTGDAILFGKPPWFTAAFSVTNAAIALWLCVHRRRRQRQRCKSATEA
jgi:ABC-type bacteriocin/lantibiotic exporter with double-glycine peptidase domain